MNQNLGNQNLGNQKNTVQIGIVGAGAIATEAHIPGYQRLDSVRVTAVMDPHLDRATAVAKRFGVARATDSLEEIAQSPDIDAVSVCSPNRYHAQQALSLLKAGKHVLCEKPMALTLADASAMVEAAEAAGRRLMVGFTHRFTPANRWMKEQIENGRIGEVYSMRARFAHSGPYRSWKAVSDWFFNPEVSGGGALLDMGIHAIDLLRFFGGEVTGVSGRLRTYKHPIAAEDFAVGILDFEGGSTGIFETGWMSLPGFTGIEIYGSKGTLINDYRTVRLYEESAAGAAWTESSEMRGNGWNEEFAHFVELIRNPETQPHSTPRDGTESLRVALELYRGQKPPPGRKGSGAGLTR